MKYLMKKTKGGLAHFDDVTEQALDKYSNGTILQCQIVSPRNIGFHKKFFALLRVGFNYWEPAEIGNKFGTPEKSFEQFKSDVIILSGFYEVAHRIDGSTRITPRSISFASMSEDDFAELFKKVIDVLIKNILVGHTEEDVRTMVEAVLTFDS